MITSNINIQGIKNSQIQYKNIYTKDVHSSKFLRYARSAKLANLSAFLTDFTYFKNQNLLSPISSNSDRVKELESLKLPLKKIKKKHLIERSSHLNSKSL